MHLASGGTERATTVLVGALLGLLLMFGAESFATGWDELPPVEVVQARLTAGHAAAAAAHLPNTGPAPTGVPVPAIVVMLVLVLATRSRRRALTATPFRRTTTGAPPARRGPPRTI